MFLARYRRVLTSRNGACFSIKKQDPKEEWRIKKQIFNQIADYVIPFRSKNKEVRNPLLKSYAFLVLSRICLFGAPVFIKYAIDAMKVGSTGMDPTYLVLGYGTCFISSIVFSSFRNVQITKVSYAAMKEVSMKLYQKMLSLPKNFFAERPQSETLYQFDRGQMGLSRLIRVTNQQLLPTAFDIIVGSAMLIYYFTYPFVMTFLTSFALYSYFTFKYSGDKRKDDIKLQKANQKMLNVVLSEAIRNHENIKYYSGEGHQVSKYHSVLSQLEQSALNTNISLGILNTIQRFIFGSGLTANLVMAVHFIKRGLMEVGDVVLIQTLMLQLFNPLNMLGMMYRSAYESFVDLRAFVGLMNEVPWIVQAENARPSGPLEGRITFQNVSYHYPGKHYQILDDQSLDILPKEFVAIMGPSGSGKSTLLNLSFRTLDPTSGSVKLDGQDIKELKLDSFRSQMTIISQTPYLFNDTILNNILYCNTTSTQQDVIQICKALDMHDYISSLPLGYHTYVGDQGALFSGGEKQRISICRGLLQRKKIVLLDEPLSALDKDNANRVIALLKTYTDCTRIMVTHHTQYMKDVDRTIMLHH